MKEWRPENVFDNEQIEELRAVGCKDEHIESLALLCFQWRSWGAPASNKAIRHSLTNIHELAKALAVELDRFETYENHPAGERWSLRDALASELRMRTWRARKPEPDRATAAYAYREFRQTLSDISSVVNEVMSFFNSKPGRPKKQGTVVVYGKRVDRFTRQLVGKLKDLGLPISTYREGKAARILHVCLQAAGNPEPPDDLYRLLAPAISTLKND